MPQSKPPGGVVSGIWLNKAGQRVAVLLPCQHRGQRCTEVMLMSWSNLVPSEKRKNIKTCKNRTFLFLKFIRARVVLLSEGVENKPGYNWPTTYTFLHIKGKTAPHWELDQGGEVIAKRGREGEQAWYFSGQTDRFSQHISLKLVSCSSAAAVTRYVWFQLQ